MKDLWKNGIVVLLVIGGLYVIYLREFKRTTPNGMVLINQTVWDSIQALANKPPVVTFDTVKIKGDVVYVPVKQLPKPIVNPDSTIYVYNDSLINAEINVWVHYKTKGAVLDFCWKYLPMSTKIIETKTVYVPKIVDNPVYKIQRRLYVSLVAGGNSSAFLFGGDVCFVTKKGTLFGYEYQRYGDLNLHSVKLGIRVF